MAVNHHGLATGLMFILCPDNGMAGGRHQLRLEPDPGQFFDQPMRAFRETILVGIIGRDTGKTQKGKEIFKVRIAHCEE